MNGITIPKKRLTKSQADKIISATKFYKTQLEGLIDFANEAGIGVSSLQKAIAGKELSEQIIDKIIAAL